MFFSVDVEFSTDERNETLRIIAFSVAQKCKNSMIKKGSQ